MHFLVFTHQLEHIGQPSLSWTIGVFETLSGAKHAARNHFTRDWKPSNPLHEDYPPCVVVQQWSGRRKLRQLERSAGVGIWREVLPF